MVQYITLNLGLHAVVEPMSWGHSHLVVNNEKLDLPRELVAKLAYIDLQVQHDITGTIWACGLTCSLAQ